MIPAKYWSPTKKLMLLGAMAGGKAVEDTATGNPLTFLTNLAKPLKSLLIPFTPKQTGSGDPSPSNIRPIAPWDGLTVWQGGGNLMPHPTKGSGVNPTTGASTTDETRASTAFIPAPLTGNKSYTFSGICDKMNSFVASYNANKQFLGRTLSASRTEITVTKDSFTYGTAQGTGEIAYLRFAQAEGSSGHSIDEIDDYDYMMNVGSSALPYEPYVHITETDISFPSPVYGGILSVVSGVLRVQWAGFSATWGDGTSATDVGEGITRKMFPMVDYLQTGLANNMCNIAPYSASENANVHFYYSGSGATNRNCRLFLPSDTPDETAVTVITKLSQTYEIQLTPQQITALVGNNTLWSDANGQMVAVYFKKA